MERWVGKRFASDDFPDVVWGVSYGGLISLTAARRLAETTNAPMVIALHDPVPSPGGSLNQYEEAALARVMDAASQVVVTTKTYARQVVARFPQASDTVEVVYASFGELEEVQCLNRPVSPPCGVMNILYAGSLYEGEATGIHSLVHALALLQERRAAARHSLKLRIIGGGWGAREAVSLAQRYGISEMIGSEPQVPPAQIALETASADCLLLIGWDNPSQIPGKLFRYLPAMKPILALVEEGESAAILRNSGMGIVVPPNQPVVIADAVEQLWDSCSRGQAFLAPDVDYIQQFSEKRMGDGVADLLEGLLARPRS